ARLEFDKNGDPPAILRDMRTMSNSLGDWRMPSMKDPEMRSAIAVLRFYFEVTKKHYYAGADTDTKYGFDLWEYALQELSRFTGKIDNNGHSLDNLEPLLGIVEWVSKKFMMDRRFAELLRDEPSAITKELILAHDLEFHAIDPTRNSWTQNSGKI